MYFYQNFSFTDTSKKKKKKKEKKVPFVTHFKTLRWCPRNTKFTPIYVGLH